eukprot:403369435
MEVQTDHTAQIQEPPIPHLIQNNSSVITDAFIPVPRLTDIQLEIPPLLNNQSSNPPMKLSQLNNQQNTTDIQKQTESKQFQIQLQNNIGSPLSSTRSLIHGRQQQIYGFNVNITSNERLSDKQQNNQNILNNSFSAKKKELYMKIESKQPEQSNDVINIIQNMTMNPYDSVKMKRNLFIPSQNLDKKLQHKRMNVLIGASTSNTFQLPEVWANNLASANTSLVGFNNNKIKLENQKIKRKLATAATSQNQRISQKLRMGNGIQNSMNSAQNQRNFIETFNMPLRGRPVTIGDRTRDVIMRCDFIKQNVDKQQERLYEDLNTYQAYRSALNSAGVQQQQLQSDNRNDKEKHPISTKIYTFNTSGNTRQGKRKTFVDTMQYFNGNNQDLNLSMPQIMNPNDSLIKHVNLKLPDPNRNIIEQHNKNNDKSFENILRFLDIGKSDFDKLNRGYQTQGAKVFDVNQNTDIPMMNEKKKNKNDFYRFLLTQNSLSNQETKIMNDILIPRSILKKGERVLRKNRDSALPQNDQIDQHPYLSDYDQVMLQGKPLLRNNPLLSPKFNQILNFQHVQQDIRKIQEQNQKPGVATSITPDQMQSKETDQFPISLNNITKPMPIVTTHIIDQEESSSRQQLNIRDSDRQVNEHDVSQEQFQILNKDLQQEMTSLGLLGNEDPSNKDSLMKDDLNTSVKAQQIQAKKRIIRETIGGDGLFETQVEVIEREVDVEEYNQRKYKYDPNNRPPYDLEQRKNQQPRQLQSLKEDKIFGYNNFNEFRAKYFIKNVNALEDQNRIKSMKEARMKYAKRYSSQTYQF